MSIIAKKSDNEKNFETIPTGTHQAVCYAVWDLGMQKIIWNNQEKLQHKVVISWEINKTISTEGEYKGKRFVISKKYTLSLGEKSNLRKNLEGWSGKSLKAYEDKGFDLEQLIGKNCLINVIHEVSRDGKTYANISAVMGCQNGTQKMIPENNTNAPEWVKKLQNEAVKNKHVDEQKQDGDDDISISFDDTPNNIDDEEVPF